MGFLMFAIGSGNRLVHISDVPNGIACNCVCPACGERLVAKNNGSFVTPHFAHLSGTECPHAQETVLHLLSKEIINDQRCVMLPSYASVFQARLQRFDVVEVEQRNDISSLQPDLCGVVHKADGNDARLWIEIKVTHPVGEEKRCIIKKKGIACIEIDLSHFIDMPFTRDEIQHFLLSKSEHREWINNPLLQARQQLMEDNKRELAKQNSANYTKTHDKEQQTESRDIYILENRDVWIQPSSLCLTCKHHTTRIAINEEISKRHLPAWLHDAIDCNLRWIDRDNISSTMEYRGYYHFCHEKFNRALPTSSPDHRGRIVNEREIKQNQLVIPFLLDTVPNLIAAKGLRCEHCVRTFPVSETKFDVACNCPNVVNKHRKKR